MPSFLLAATEESSGGLIDVVPGLMIWTLICFALTFFVLKRFAFGPIQKTIDERRDRIRAAVDEADKARDEARELLEQHRQGARHRGSAPAHRRGNRGARLLHPGEGAQLGMGIAQRMYARALFEAA